MDVPHTLTSPLALPRNKLLKDVEGACQIVLLAGHMLKRELAPSIPGLLPPLVSIVLDYWTPDYI